MIELIRTLWLICTFLFAGFLTDRGKAQAQLTTDPETLIAAGNFTAAGYAYEKQAWLAVDNTEHATALISRISCYFMESRFDDAYAVSGRFRYEGLHDTLETKCRHIAAWTAYLSGKYAESISELKQLQFMVQDTSLTSASLFLMALSYNELRQWKDADSVLQVMVQRADIPVSLKDSLGRYLHEQYDPRYIPALKSRDKAELWSTFIPGAGQIYSGYVGEGVLSFTLQVASLAFIGYHIYIAHYLTAFTIGSGLFQHFYFGGVNRAGFLADKRNYTTLRQFNDPRKIKILQIQQLIYPRMENR
jgi:TM2 domain-containing membrane protein YozV